MDTLKCKLVDLAMENEKLTRVAQLGNFWPTHGKVRILCSGSDNKFVHLIMFVTTA